MTENKPQTVDAYFGSFADDIAAILQQVRAAIRSVSPDVEEAIKYDMAMFRYAGTYLYVAGWKKHVGLCPIHPADDAALEAEIAPYRAKKDTVQFQYKHPIPYDLIARIADARKQQG